MRYRPLSPSGLLQQFTPVGRQLYFLTHRISVDSILVTQVAVVPVRIAAHNDQKIIRGPKLKLLFLRQGEISLPNDGRTHDVLNAGDDAIPLRMFSMEGATLLRHGHSTSYISSIANVLNKVTE
jgi:hypothetical protein